MVSSTALDDKLAPYSPENSKLTLQQMLNRCINMIHRPNKKEKQLIDYCLTAQEILKDLTDPNDVKEIHQSLEFLSNRVKQKHQDTKQAFQETQSLTEAKRLELCEEEVRNLFNGNQLPFHQICSFCISDHLPKELREEIKYIIEREGLEENIHHFVNFPSFLPERLYQQEKFSMRYYTAEGMSRLKELAKKVTAEFRCTLSKLDILSQSLQICYPVEAQKIRAMQQVRAKNETLVMLLPLWEELIAILEKTKPKISSVDKADETISFMQWKEREANKPLIIHLKDSQT
ncbi:MAG: hypothetical protein H7A37_09530 [Chlamydiales bacterium]|nr:hypothetical protein [Chlamydiia bacterium]MCP5508518.1 hypothetical protein [Chlamydiales bacterium]